MSEVCCVCNGRGLLLDDTCPLCDGDASFPLGVAPGSLKPSAQIGEKITPAGSVPIFILAGQSNCVGRGVPTELPPDLVARVGERARLCFDLERHRPEEAHSAGWAHLTPASQMNPVFGEHFGPEFSIAAELLAAPELQLDSVLLAKFAMGSSSVVIGRDGAQPEWDPDGEHVSALIRFLQDQCELAGSSAYIAGMFWNQGNSDVKVKESDGSAARYTERLQALVMRLRRELAPHLRVGLPFVACHVRKGSKPKTAQNVNNAIERACKELESAMCIPLPEGSNLLPNDDFHLDGPSLLTLGRAFADSMRTFL